MARTQALLTRTLKGGVNLTTLVREELSGQAFEQGEYKLQGPEVVISPKAAEVLNLAIHELATNALKYGAFSEPNGQVSVNWEIASRNGDSWLSFHWSEKRARPVPPATSPRPGFGTELIERRIPYELRGVASLKFDGGGALCKIEFPLRDRASVLETELPRRVVVPSSSKQEHSGADLRGFSILIVEDDYYLAADLERALGNRGASIDGPFSAEAPALEWLKTHRPHVALVDINLGRGPSFEVANTLREKKTPLIFVTGYEGAALPAEFAENIRFQKPIDVNAVSHAIARLLENQNAA